MSSFGPTSFAPTSGNTEATTPGIGIIVDQVALHAVTGHAPGAFGLMDQSAVHVATGPYLSAYGFVDAAAVHVALEPLPVRATQILSINT